LTIKDFFDTAEKGVIETRAAKARVFVFSTVGWSVIESHLSKTFGSGAEVVMSEMGAAYGKGVAQEALRVSSVPETALGFIISIAAAAGWGQMSVEGDITKPSDFAVLIKECVFCSDQRAARSPACHFLGGVTRGAAEGVFKVPYKVREEKCARKGDEICRFLLQRQREIPSS